MEGWRGRGMGGWGETSRSEPGSVNPVRSRRGGFSRWSGGTGVTDAGSDHGALHPTYQAYQEVSIDGSRRVGDCAKAANPLNSLWHV